MASPPRISDRMVLYYISDRKQFPGTDSEKRDFLLRRIAEAASAGVDYIQLREKDLSPGELEQLARQAVRTVRDHSDRTRLLINSRADVALGIGADGVHLTSTDIAASDARAIWATSLAGGNSELGARSWLVGASCHSVAEVRAAESHGADFAVLAPVFEKPGTQVPALGLEGLRAATRSGQPPDRRVEAGDQRAIMPVLALGGVTVENAQGCLAAGAAGVAGIRLFQGGNVRETVVRLWG